MLAQSSERLQVAEAGPTYFIVGAFRMTARAYDSRLAIYATKA